MRSVLLLIVAFLLAGAAAWYFGRETAQAPVAVTPEIRSFEDCVAAGNPVMESSPRQCRTADGRTYAEEPTQADLDGLVVYDNAEVGEVEVENPYPTAVVGKDFTVTGTARGWYFEASFPVEVRSPSGALLAAGPATAQGDWMTTDPVPFVAPLSVTSDYIGPATLILRRDNPSGLPENDASISFPITIEY